VVEFPLDGHRATIGAMAKGSGMIAPNMATMLAFFTTDAALDPRLLHRALREAVGVSLNRITVDGDTSTNDMAVVLASGAAPAKAIMEEGRDYDAFRAALTQAAREIAGMIVRDGEGATRVAEVWVEGARVESDADRIARTVAESPLVKTALNGGDPNWGRVLAAVGRAGVELDMSRVDLFLGDVWVAEGGRARAYDEARRAAALAEDPIRIRVRLKEGAPRAGCGPATCRTATWTSTPTTGAERVKLWGGNYSAGPDAAFWEFNRSFPFDRRLLAEEVAGRARTSGPWRVRAPFRRATPRGWTPDWSRC
jgi:glutamate N-acetyltransferase/amino-acid N-acetyltransferase